MAKTLGIQECVTWVERAREQQLSKDIGLYKSS